MLHPWLLLLVHEEYVSQSILFFLSKGIHGILFMEEKNLHCIVSNRNMWMARPFKNRPKFLHIFSLHLVVVFNTYFEVMMQCNTHISYSNLWRTLWTGYLGLGKYPLLNETTYLGPDERLTKLAFTYNVYFCNCKTLLFYINYYIAILLVCQPSKYVVCNV